MSFVDADILPRDCDIEHSFVVVRNYVCDPALPVHSAFPLLRDVFVPVLVHLLQ